MKSLDTASVLFSSSLIYGVLAVVIAFYYRTQRTYPGFRDWLIFTLGQALGLLMLMSYPAGGPAHPLFILVTNLVLVATADRLLRGLARFAGEESRYTRSELAFYAAALAIFIYALAVDPQTSARLSVVAVCIGLVSARSGLLALRLSRGAYRAEGRFLVAVQVVAVLIQVARVVAALVQAGPGELLRRSGPEAALLAALASCGVGTGLGLLLLTAQRAQRELAEARAQVLQLEGIIPICMYCHKVRNDQEAWDRIETYIARHSAARFSHGICPECLPIQFPAELQEDRVR
jgi:hypothetical protein